MRIKKSIVQNIGLIFLGIIVSLILLEVGMRLLGLILYSIQRADALDQKGEYIILTLGESTTADLFNGESSWPAELETILNNRSRKTRFKVINEGIPSITSDTLLARLPANIEKYHPDLIISMMGINDINAQYAAKQEQPFIQKTLSKLKVFKLFRLIYLSLNDTLNNEKTEERNETSYAALLNSQEFQHYLQANNVNPRSPYFRAYLEAFDNPKEGMELVLNYRDKLEELTRKNPKDIEHMNKLAQLYLSLGQWNASEEILLHVLSLNSSDALSLNVLCRLYGETQNFQRRLEVCSQLATKNKGEFYVFEIYSLLGQDYRSFNQTDKAIYYYEEIFALNNKEENVFAPLLALYLEKKDLKKASDLFKHAKKVNANNTYVEIEFLWYYVRNDLVIPDEISQEFTGNPAVSIEIGKRFELLNNTDKAREWYNKAQVLKRNELNPITKKNYQELGNLAQKYGIEWIPMQYPTLLVEELMLYFEDPKEMVFISNERNFEEGIAQEGYPAFFIDNFAGTFGHCTRKGNLLIAENVAETILSEIGTG